jgi:phosphate transport system substrate-binding protein
MDACRKLVVGLLVIVLGFGMFGTTLAQDGTTPGAGQITGPAKGEAQNLKGIGAALPTALFDRWFANYGKLTGVKIDYQTKNSGAGVRSLIDQTVDFGVVDTDAPLLENRLAEAPGGSVLQIPIAVNGVVAVYNVPELAGADPLKLTAETLPLIFLGERGRTLGDNSHKPLIKWNDVRLVKDNPALRRVDKFILVFYRSDSAGATNAWTNYLSAVSADWAVKVGAGNSVAWPTGIAPRGNASLAEEIRRTAYSISFMALSEALAENLPVAQVKNRAGYFMVASPDAVSLAGETAAIQPHLRVKIVNASGKDAYPIASFVWLMVYQKQTDPAKALALTRFLWWATHDSWIAASGDPILRGFAPLPQPVLRTVESMITQIKVNGVMALPKSIADSVKR